MERIRMVVTAAMILDCKHPQKHSKQSHVYCREPDRHFGTFRVVEGRVGYVFACFVVLISLFQSPLKVAAQDTDKKTYFLIEPYLLMPAMKGDIGVYWLPNTEVDANAGDIFDQLNFGAMAYLEVNFSDQWYITADFLYMDLEQDITSNGLVTGGIASAKQLVFELAGLKKVTPWLDIGVGARAIDMKADLGLNTIVGTVSGSSGETWVDPIIIVRSQGIAHEKWLLQLRGDLGGFGIGSDFTWQFQANVGYQFSRLFHIAVGYRVLDIDYEQGDGREHFLYDITTTGPVIRLGFNFE